MKLIVGLGNPGPDYDNHKHNIGFWVIDGLAKRRKLKWEKGPCQALEAWGAIAKEDCWLAKPLTWMNNSGKAVQMLLETKQVTAKDMIVIHDDLDLKLGTLRWAFSSGHGGHNGVRSIIETLQTKDFYRLRVGIGRSPAHVDPADYVLQPFAGEDLETAEAQTKRAGQSVEDFIEKGFAWVQNHYH